MRKLLFAFLFTTLCHFNVKAQETSELKIGIGDAITFEILSAMENIFTGHAGGVDTSMIFPYVFVDYRFPISERSKIGIQAGYYNYNGTINPHGNELKSSAFTLLPGIDYRYLQKNKFKMYGNAMIGVSFLSSKYDGDNHSDVIFAFQVNPLGFSYGENTAVFAELGIGISIFNAGLKFKL
ncbi:hypothetical protein [Faecalibacter bovis]|uniref:Outer membrane protein beta-barrel domain-containing protein n=1 Tax=Faecalibacter bovis TaxID=2898187 RepID=A0ABX7XGE9_9FLAO|nr:hypothetical protein [Faecalibacter bovis]QTV06937.1 hypothetical protein J9309_06425 [Faecalibacter bovis]